jgi:ribosomal protein S12 methylthiotransferase
VDLAFGPDELGRILEAVIDDPAPDERISIDALYTSREVPTIPRLRTTPPHLAYLKISEGCDHACAFCAIPGFRGSFRSRTRENLLAEARRLADDGVRELVLVSQDTLAWGKDLGGGEGLMGLLEGLLEVAPLRWIRLLYCYPNLLSSSLIELIASEDRLCNYFDIPFQHASARVLERMRRGGSREGFARQIDRIRQRVPGASIRTSFIVGFPGETDEDFAELAQFVEETGFDHLGVFIYSDEDGTAAIRLDGKVKPGTARARRNKLMERQARITKRRLGRLVGATLPVMLEGLSSESDLLLEGRTEGQAPEIDGRVLINDAGEIDPAAGRIYRTEITRALEYDLVGRIVGEC